MVNHLDNCTLHRFLRHRKNTKNDKAEVSNRRICNKFFHIGLNHCNQGAVNNSDYCKD